MCLEPFFFSSVRCHYNLDILMWANCLDERYLLTFEFGGCFSVMPYRLVSFSEGAHLLGIFRLLF